MVKLQTFLVDSIFTPIFKNPSKNSANPDFNKVVIKGLHCFNTVKPVLSGHSKRQKIGFQDRLSLNADQKYCRMLQGDAECSKGSIPQYFRPSLSYHLSLRSLFCLFQWPLKTGFTVILTSKTIH